MVQKLEEVFFILCREPGSSREQSQCSCLLLALLSQQVLYKLSELRVKVIRPAQGIAPGRVGRLPTKRLLPKTD